MTWGYYEEALYQHLTSIKLCLIIHLYACTMILHYFVFIEATVYKSETTLAKWIVSNLMFIVHERYVAVYPGLKYYIHDIGEKCVYYYLM